MAGVAREDIIQVLNKTWSPCCSMKEGNFTAFGSTPVVDLLKDLDMGKKIDLLLVQQGDLRHVIKTIAAMNHYKDGIEQKALPDQVTFRFVDSEPANIARNVLIFELLEAAEDDSEDMEFIWNVWFNSCLSDKHLDRIHGVLGNLLEDDGDFELGRNWKFNDERSKSKGTQVWKKWVAIKENGVFREGFDGEFLFRFESYSSLEPNESRRYATKWPYKKFGEFQRELDKWNKNGSLTVRASTNSEIANPEMANPTMFRKDDVLFNVEPKLCPFSVFCPLKSDSVGTHSSLTETCFEMFVEIVRDMKLVMQQIKVKINFEVGSSLEYLSSHKEGKYNLIHTSDMADDSGLINTLLVCEPLLTQENSVLITTTETLVYMPRKEYIATQAGGSTCSLPTLLGVNIAENLSLGQNFIGKDSPIQTYRWVKCAEADTTKISLKDSPELLKAFRTCLDLMIMAGSISAMTLATVVKRFQERTTDSPEFVLENVKGILKDHYWKSFRLVCKILGIIPSQSLRIVKATLDATGLGVVLKNGTAVSNGEDERLVLVQPQLFLSLIPDVYQTDIYYCNRETETITLVMEEEEYNRKLKYNINCTSNPLNRPFLSEIVKARTTIVLDEIKQESENTEQALVKEGLETYTLEIDFIGKLLDGSSELVFNKRPCRVSVCFTDSNGKHAIPVALTCQLTSEFHIIDIDKSAQKLHVTLYKECLQRMGDHLLPLSTLEFESTKPSILSESKVHGLVHEVKAREELMPKEMDSSYANFIVVRGFMQDILLKQKWINHTDNAVHIYDVNRQEMFLKIDGVYNFYGYPVASVSFLTINDKESANTLSTKKTAEQNGWRFGKMALRFKMNMVFDILLYLLIKNSKRVPQNSLSNIPGCCKSFLDLRFSDFDDKELPKSQESPVLSIFQGYSLRLDWPGEYHKCSHCLQFRTHLTPCDHCGEALYCGDSCAEADFARHVVLGQFQDNQHAEDLPHECKSCGRKATSAKACSKCKEAYYCDRKCQEKDWPDHKTSCKKSSQQTTDPALKRNLLGAFTAKPAKRESHVDDTPQTDPSFKRAKTTRRTHAIDADDSCETGSKNRKAPKRDKDDASVTLDETEEESVTPNSNAPTPNLQCGNCRGPVSNLITCTVCNMVRYCGYQCQLTHWPQHHKQCMKHLLVKLGEQL